MAKTAVGLYENSERAHRAIEDLVNAGLRREDISLTARSEEQGHVEGVSGRESEACSGTVAGAGIGAGIGGIGGLLVGLGLLTIPGLGPIVVAGPLAALLRQLEAERRPAARSRTPPRRIAFPIEAESSSGLVIMQGRFSS